MAVKNRPVIGTVHCEHCEGTRSLHMYETGRHKDKIYTRCPSCTDHKFSSKTSAAEQRFLRSKATFKPEFAHLALTVEQPETPKQQETSGVPAKTEPQTTPNTDPKPQTQKPRKGAGLLLALVGGITLTLIGLTQ